MELTGEKVLEATREQVYEALHDPNVLRQAIPGCQRFTQVKSNRFKAEITRKIGPIMSGFVTVIEVYDNEPPVGYSLRGVSSAGGAVGGAEGDAHIRLTVIDPGTTNIAYHLTATPDGRLASLGASILGAKVKTLATEFFSRLQLILETGGSPAMEDAFRRADSGVFGRIAYGAQDVFASAAPDAAPEQPAWTIQVAESQAATASFEVLPVEPAPFGTPVAGNVPSDMSPVVVEAEPPAQRRTVTATVEAPQPIARREEARAKTALLPPQAPINGHPPAAAPIRGSVLQERLQPGQVMVADFAAASERGARRWLLTMLGAGVIVFLLSNGF